MRSGTLLSLAMMLVGVGVRGPQAARIYSTYNNDEFGFSLTIPDDLARAGWGIIEAANATVIHTFSPPDTSSWEPAAVVISPGSSFPLLSPIFVDIFNVKDPTVSVLALADRKADRVGDDVNY